MAPRFDAYREGRADPRDLRRYTDLIEPLSLDEAYLDVTEPCRGATSAMGLARAIKARHAPGGRRDGRPAGRGSAFVSPALAALGVAEAIIFDKHKVLPVCAFLEGEYGVQGLPSEELPSSERAASSG